MTASGQILARLALLACLSLPALIFFPHAQHVFWASEHLSAILLAPLAALLAWHFGKPGPGQEIGKALFLLLAGLWFLSAAFSIRVDLAARELAGWLCSPLPFYAAQKMAQGHQERRRLAGIMLATGAALAAYGLIQSAGWEPSLAGIIRSLGRAFHAQTFGFESLNWAVTFGGRAGSFLGNPNFLGGHMALLLPLSVALALDDRRPPMKILGWLAAAACAIGLIVSQTRGAWAGGALGLGLTLWLSHKRMPGLLRRNRLGLWLLAGFAGLALAGFFAAHSQNLSRLTQIFKGDEELSRRGTLMKAGLKMALDHPLLGVGPGNFRIHFPTVQLAGVPAGQEASRPYIYSEHAHNDFIQMAADCGFPAALAFAALVFWALASLYRCARQSLDSVVEREEQDKDPLLACGAFGGLIALLVHGLANFPFLILPTQMTAWALAALALNVGKAPQAAAQAGPWKKPAQALGWGLYFTAAFFAGRLLNEDALWWMGQGEIGLGNHARGREVVFKALELNPGRREDRLWYQHALANLGETHTYNATGSLKEALRLNPYYMEARAQLGKAQASLNLWTEAKETLAPGVKHAPNYAPLWEPLAASLFMTGDFEQAVRAYDWALAFNPPNAPELLDNKAAALGSQGKFNEAVAVLAESEKKDPNRAKLHLNKAVTFLKMGLKEPARASLKRAKELDPGDPQIPVLTKALR